MHWGRKERGGFFSEQRHQLMILLNSCSPQTNLKFWLKFLPHAVYLPKFLLSQRHLLHSLQHSLCLLVPISARYWEISQRIIESKPKLLLILFTWKMVYSHRKQELYQIFVKLQNSVDKSSNLIFFKCTLVIFIYSKPSCSDQKSSRIGYYKFLWKWDLKMNIFLPEVSLK